MSGSDVPAGLDLGMLMAIVHAANADLLLVARPNGKRMERSWPRGYAPLATTGRIDE